MSNLLCKSVDGVIHKRTLVLTTYMVFHYVYRTSHKVALNRYILFMFFYQSILKPSSNIMISSFLEMGGKYKA